MLPRNVVSLVKPPRDDREPKGPMLRPEEARKLLEVVRDDLLEACYLVLLTGLRRGEAFGLRWEHVQLDGQTVACSIPLPVMTVLALRERQAAQQAEQRFMGRETGKHPTSCSTLQRGHRFIATRSPTNFTRV